MYEGWMDRLAVITADHDKVRGIQDELEKLNLFDRFSFNVESMEYWVYLKPVGMDDVASLAKLLEENNWRLVTYND